MKITVVKSKLDGTETASRKPFPEQAALMHSRFYAQGGRTFGRFCDSNGQVSVQVGQSDPPGIAKNLLRQVHD